MIWADHVAVAVFAIVSACIACLLLWREPLPRLDQVFGLCVVIPAAMTIPLWWGLRFIDWLFQGARRRSRLRSKTELNANNTALERSDLISPN